MASPTSVIRQEPISSVSEPLAEQPVKRRRIGVACSVCRIRKSRCNGQKPCSLCASLDAECTYETTDAPTAVTLNKSYVTNLEHRIAKLERKMHSLESAPTTPAPARGPSPDRNDQNGSPPRRATEACIRLDKDSVQDLSPEECEADGMAFPHTPSTANFFGPTSNVYLLRQIERVITATTQYSLPETSPDCENIPRSDIGLLAPQDSYLLTACWDDGLPVEVDYGVDRYVLPPGVRLSSMIDVFFADINSTWGYLYEPTFRDTFSQVKETGFKHVRRSWLGLLNMILAMVERRKSADTDSDDGIQDKSYIFFSRALLLVTRTTFQGPNLETVQCLLLATVYLHRRTSVQCWMMHGLAVKAAYTVGLHSKDDHTGLSERQRETRKRVWWGCINLDRILGMTFGRPLMIPEAHCTVGLPEPIEIELRHTPGFVISKALSVSFLSSSILLHQIVAQIVSCLYGGNLKLSDESNADAQTAAHVFDLERQLEAWCQSLPQGLDIRDASTIVTTAVPGTDLHHAERLRVILTLRHLNAQILLRRPALTYALHMRFKGSVEFEPSSSWQLLQSNLLERCLQSAEEMISILHLLATSGTQGKALLGAPWTTVYYAFNASLVMFGSILATPLVSMAQAPVPSHVSKVGFCIKQAEEIVRNIDVDRIILDKCARYLSRLSEVIETWVSRLSTNENSDFATHGLELDQVFVTAFPLSDSITGFI